jgi:hypothetical protein
MSKNSAKQLYTQTMEWLPTAFKSRKKRSKQRVNNNQSRLTQYEKRQ